MKKPIAVRVNNKKEYDLAIEALDSAGFEWYNGKEMTYYDYYHIDPYICVSPAGYVDDKGLMCVFWEEDDWDLKDKGIDCEILSIDDFIKLFSSMTEQDAIDFCNSYFEEEEAPEPTEPKKAPEKTWDGLLKITPSFFSGQELDLIYDLVNLLLRNRELEHGRSFSKGLYCTDVPEKLTTENKDTLLFKL